MTDIIKDAKQLLDAATPGPWELTNGEIHQIQHTPEQCTSIRCDHRWPVLSESWGESAAVAAEDEDLALMAAAPEMAQALAEETYFYGVQVWVGGRWIMMLNSNHGTSLMHRGKWFERKDEAQACAAKWNHDTPTRIVRQRRSPVEEIE